MDGISTYISTFGVLGVGIYLIWKEYRSGSTTLNNQVVDNFRVLDEQQKEKITERDVAILKYQKDVTEIKGAMARMKEDFAKQIGVLQGQITAKDKQISDLQSTILNRNPELENLLAEIKDFMENIYNQNKHQTVLLESNQVRNNGIDDATATKDGNILRQADE